MFWINLYTLDAKTTRQIFAPNRWNFSKYWTALTVETIFRLAKLRSLVICFIVVFSPPLVFGRDELSIAYLSTFLPPRLLISSRISRPHPFPEEFIARLICQLLSALAKWNRNAYHAYVSASSGTILACYSEICCHGDICGLEWVFLTIFKLHETRFRRVVLK